MPELMELPPSAVLFRDTPFPPEGLSNAAVSNQTNFGPLVRVVESQHGIKDLERSDRSHDVGRSKTWCSNGLEMKECPVVNYLWHNIR
jgi:hypothetical protein